MFSMCFKSFSKGMHGEMITDPIHHCVRAAENDKLAYIFSMFFTFSKSQQFPQDTLCCKVKTSQ